MCEYEVEKSLQIAAYKENNKGVISKLQQNRNHPPSQYPINKPVFWENLRTLGFSYLNIEYLFCLLEYDEGFAWYAEDWDLNEIIRGYMKLTMDIPISQGSLSDAQWTKENLKRNDVDNAYNILVSQHPMQPQMLKSLFKKPNTTMINKCLRQ